ncbi:hypothetical protein C7212DRAFT_231085, partial [Tuber magnatum]
FSPSSWNGRRPQRHYASALCGRHRRLGSRRSQCRNRTQCLPRLHRRCLPRRMFDLFVLAD